MTPNSFVFDDTLHSHSASSKQSSQSGTEKFLKIILVILAVILIAEAVWFCLIKTSLPLENVEINGIPGAERNDVFQYAGITNKTSFFSVNTIEMENSLEDWYLVDSAKVVKQFPDKIYIKLNPRIPAVMTFASVDGKSVPLFIDKRGVVCHIGNSDAAFQVQSSALPIISGLVFDNVSLGMRLPVSLRGFLESIERINVNNPVLLSSISEINIQEKLYDGFELVLYLLNSKIKVRTGPELNEDTLKYMMLMIDVLENTGAELDELDFRTGTASYQLKEALNG
ncbi:MAG: FtsQ-type POTRA domain-containing protein [Treponema sp.]|jgi:cell division protein FtsQ|nr:FtsQ-type POTRA domain-containing protein [Treponema sp.]